MHMTMVIRIPPVPADLPPGTVMVAQEVILKLEAEEVESLVETLRDPQRQIELLYDGVDHRVESVQTPSGTEVWIIVVVAKDAALVILPVEPQDDGVSRMPESDLN
jgi:effector-binding domain-containing protein